MPEVVGIEKLLSHIPKKRFGLFREYGASQFGYSVYGEGPIYIIIDKGPPVKYLSDKAGNPINFAGIYRTDNVTGITRYYREPYYITKNPRYAPQQAWRQIFADAVLAWQGLTPAEKAVYNIKAKGKRMSGYNLFLKEYLLSS
jgi:hypothetical protein